METAVPVGRPRTVARMAFLGGAIYVVLFVIGTVLLFSGAPANDSAPAKVIQWYSDSGHRDRVNGGWVLIGLSLFFLLWFVAAAVALSDGIRTMSDDTYQHRVFPELIHLADDVGWVMHATGALGLAAMIIAASLAFMWAGSWPTWAGWLGVVVGILSLASIVFFPQFLFLLWILIVSILMFLRSTPTPRTV
jgi:hypothetical protein